MRCALVLVAACSSASNAPEPPGLGRPTPHLIERPAHPKVTGRVTGVRIAAAIDDGPASDRSAYARADQTVVLYAVVEADAAGQHVVYSDAIELELGGHRVKPVALADAPAIELRWNRIEPATASLSNTDGGDFHFATIDYRATPIVGPSGTGSIVGPSGTGSIVGSRVTADVRPTLTTDHGHGVGTMRFQLIARQGDRVIASPGAEARRGKGSGGLTDAVMRVTIRRDDTYLGFLTELYGQPYVWASAGLSDATHQSERLEGCDCADFVVYGARRMGARIAYTWTGGLPGVTKLLAAGTPSEDGIYRDGHGVPIPFTQVGDLILFPRHVGALAEDRGTIGVLDTKDLMMHSLFDSPQEQPIADSGYADKPVELRRFTASLHRDR